MTSSEPQQNTATSIVGVRVVGQRRLTFARCDLEVETGAAVAVQTVDGERPGVIVVASHLLLEYHGAAPTARVVRLLSDPELGSENAGSGRSLLDSLQLSPALLDAHGLASYRQPRNTG